VRNYHCTVLNSRGTDGYAKWLEDINSHLAEVAAAGWVLILTNWAANQVLFFWEYEGL
jgi:hypothetical protein